MSILVALIGFYGSLRRSIGIRRGRRRRRKRHEIMSENYRKDCRGRRCIAHVYNISLYTYIYIYMKFSNNKLIHDNNYFFLKHYI